MSKESENLLKNIAIFLQGSHQPGKSAKSQGKVGTL